MTAAADVEQRRAEAARALEQAGQARAEADRAAAAALARLREAVLAARHAGVSVRRCAELAGVSADSVDRWTREHRDATLDRVRGELEKLTDPDHRAWLLIDIWPAEPWRTRVSDRGVLLTAAYRAVRAADPGTAPDPDAARAAVTEAVQTARQAATPGRPTVEVLRIARTAAPVHAVMARLDEAALTLLIDQPAVWQEAVRPHLPPRSSNAFAAADAVLEALNAALTAGRGRR